MKRNTACSIIKEWRTKHPHARPRDLYQDTFHDLPSPVSRSSVDRYWSSCGAGEKPYSATDLVSLWRQEHPNGRPCQCVKDTGLSRRSVFLRWNGKKQPLFSISDVIEVQEEPKEDESGQFYFDF